MSRLLHIPSFTLGLAFVAMSCHPGKASQASLHDAVDGTSDIAQGELRVGVYSVIDTPDQPRFYTAVMGPYIEKDPATGESIRKLKAFEMKGCRSASQVYSVLGIDPEASPEKKLNEEDIKDTIFELIDDFSPPYRSDLLDHGINEQAISCESEDPVSAAWYWDFNEAYYFPKDKDGTIYYRVPQDCSRLVDIYANRMMEPMIPARPEDLSPDAIIDVACGSAQVAVPPPFRGWALGRLANQNLNFYATSLADEMNVALYVLTYVGDGEPLILPILSLNKQTLKAAPPIHNIGYTPDNRPIMPDEVPTTTPNIPAVDLDEIRKALTQITEKVVPGLPELEDLTTSLPDDVQSIVLDKLRAGAVPLLELCFPVTAACKPKAHFLAEDMLTVDKPYYPRRFKLVPATLKTQDKAIMDGQVLDVVSALYPQKPANDLRLGIEPCSEADLRQLFGIQPITAASSTLADLKATAFAQYPYFKSAAVNRKVGCFTYEGKICRRTVSSEPQLLQALSGSDCPSTSSILQLNVISDIEVTAPIAVSGARFTRIEWAGTSIKENEVTRAPRLIKTYGGRDFTALIQATHLSAWTMRNLEMKSLRLSPSDVALELKNIEYANLEQLSIRSATPTIGFSNGVKVQSSRMFASQLGIETLEQGIVATSSGLTLSSQTNRISAKIGLKLVQSYLGFDGLEFNIKDRSGLELLNGSALFGQLFKAVGVNAPLAVGLWLEKGKSSVAIAQAEFTSLYTPAYLKLDNGQPNQSEIGLTKSICSQVETDPSTLCKVKL